MPRMEFPRKVRLAIIQRANGRCEACEAVLKVGEGEVDHILPDALGGKPEQANGRLICRVCHKAKTAHDINRIRKADRQRDRQNGALKKKPWHGNLRKKMNGEVVDRRTGQPLSRSLTKDTPL